MGRIKTKLTKRKTQEIMKLYGEKVTEDYMKNKEVAKEVATFKSKKMKNIVAGYLTRLKKAQEDI